MTAQEWLEFYAKFSPKVFPDYTNEASDIIRAQQEQIERLEGEVERLQDEVRDACGSAHDMESLAAEKEAMCEGLKDSIRRANNAWEECTGHPYPACAEANINKLRQELADAKSLAASRLADQEYKKVIDDALVVANIGVATGDAKADLHKLICWEIDVALDPRVSKRAADLISERETEVEKLTHERDLWENMAAMRLADQEAIERHTAKRVAGEICDYLCREWPFMGAGAVLDIKEKYEMEVG